MTNTLAYVVLAGNQQYYVVRADDRSIRVATFANRYEAYADAQARHDAYLIDKGEEEAGV